MNKNTVIVVLYHVLQSLLTTKGNLTDEGRNFPSTGIFYGHVDNKMTGVCQPLYVGASQRTDYTVHRPRSPLGEAPFSQISGGKSTNFDTTLKIHTEAIYDPVNGTSGQTRTINNDVLTLISTFSFQSLDQPRGATPPASSPTLLSSSV